MYWLSGDEGGAPQVFWNLNRSVCDEGRFAEVFFGEAELILILSLILILN